MADKDPWDVANEVASDDSRSFEDRVEAVRRMYALSGIDDPDMLSIIDSLSKNQD